MTEWSLGCATAVKFWGRCADTIMRLNAHATFSAEYSPFSSFY